jgi:hypothetical protein
MARVGIVLNLVGVIVIATVFYVIGLSVFGIDLSAPPEWAAATAGVTP